ncbi:MAG: bifunctional homocysteine S-methyltransferase/methylenetetrahydrofolate reductase [candidate division Zixibacteria bacterium RBG_16_53_22]|nr:MAG: bifunctional homocysteine S-methyltransferase/methylenetetrahydrofolate reductase [candidate division Zixibacteria bacterium RBG_16_53_22]
MAINFKAKLDGGIIICDGAMGTYLNQKGISYDRCLDELDMSMPKLVGEIHREYIHAGADMIETNTFGANRFRLALHGLENNVRDINIAGAKIAREAREISGVDIIVAGSIGPIGKPLEPIGKVKFNEARDAFAEQAGALLEGGVDLFLIETISSLDEMLAAVEGVRGISDLPLVAQMTFTAEGTTYLGHTPADMVSRLMPLGINVIGANCSVGPQKMLEVVEQLSELGVEYISAQPNAGLPRYLGGRFIYLSSPDYFADYAKSFVKAGARIVGGCCGTTPDHIAAVVRAIRGSDIRRGPSVSRIEGRHEKKAQEPVGGALTRFYEKLKKDFVVSVEIDPPKGTNPAKLIEAAAKIKNAGADAVNVADSPMARVRMSCMALAYLINSAVDIDIVLHYTTRDRNLMGLQADLIGANAVGLRNILALTGDPPSIGDYPQATAVYDVDSVGLIQVISRLNSGTDLAGNSIGNPTAFSIGFGANPTAPNLDFEVSRIKLKLEAGGQYMMTQPLYELEPLLRFLDIVKPDVPILLGILPLVSFKHAQFLHNEVPGISVPESIRRAMEKAGDKSAKVGGELAAEFIEKARGFVTGIYLMPSFGRFETCIELVEVLKRFKPIDASERGFHRKPG